MAKTPMAKKLFNPLENPPTASSSDEEDEVETSSGEEQISNSSSEDPATTKTLKTPSAAAPSSGSDSRSETGSDSESEPLPEKTIAVTAAAKPKKKEGNDSPAAKSGKKRASEVATSSKDMQVKKAKKVSGDDEIKSFQRLWSEEDETSLLQAMIDFKAEKGTSPYDDMNGFFDMAKKNISFDVSKIQLGDKVRSLKKKYFGKQNKGFESSHDNKCLGLARYIWGSDGMALESAVKSHVANGVFEEDKEVILGGDSESSDWFEKSFLVKVIASLGVNEYFMKKKWSKMPVEIKKRIEEKLKLVEAKEFELVLQKADIMDEVASVITEVI